MAKKTPVKKTKRRLKRSVRRSLAAVLMITSIAVAAIPVPENYADNGDAAGAGTGSVSARAADVHEEAVKKDFVYDVDDAKQDSAGSIAAWASSNLNKFVKDGELNEDNDDPNSIWSKYDPDADPANDPGTGNGAPTTYASMVIRDVDGESTISWQFMYYVRNIQGSGIGTGKRGVICKYNGEYMAEKVDLPMVLNTQYYTVEREFLENYFNGLNPDGSELTGSNKWNSYVDMSPDSVVYEYSWNDYQNKTFYNDATKHYYETYFPAELASKQAEFKRYEDSYDKETGQYTEDEELKKSLIKKPMEIRDSELQAKFYCEHDKVLLRQSSAYTLVSVQNQMPGDAGAAGGIIYVAKGGQPAEGYYNDTEGYLVTRRANYLICGIGASAFKGNDRIQNLELPSMISFIGDNAFEGASLIKEINIANASFIGNQAFKDCGSLSKVVIGEGTNTIGAECFYHTAVDSIKLPSTTQDIGYGAFALCNKLTSIDLNSISQSCKIRDFAFYECSALNDVKMKDAQIVSIGKGAFACTGGAELDFVFPSEMTSYEGSGSGRKNTIGDFMFAGRANLRSVVFPEKYGRTETTQVKLPENMFHECTGLSHVEFPAANDQFACGYVSYDTEKMFADVANMQFYVRGPKMKNMVDPADPRTTTWSAKMAIKGNPIPYVYVENGKEYYEVSNGWYLYCVDDQGVITSCTLTPDARQNHMNEIKRNGIDLDILPVVGTRKVVAIATDCFSDEDLNQNVKSLSIPDDSLTEINADVFKGWKRLAQVTIGNSVTTIGDRAFADCDKLVDVTFHSPAVGHEAFKVGQDAFKTGSDELTFHGDIVKGYAPFDWAVDKDNLIESTTGIRVCYKSLAPTYLTVMYDANTGYVTLLDYPKYDKIDDLINQAHEKEWSSLGYSSYAEMREAVNYEIYSADTYNSVRDSFRERWNAAQTDEEREAVYNSEFYGPWVNPTFCQDIANGRSGNTDESAGDGAEGTGIGDELIDFFFEPIVVQAASRPMAFYEKEPYSVLANAESDNSYRALTLEEQALVTAAKNIVVPDGVDSIDVSGYMTGSDANKLNASKYLSLTKLGRETYSMYTSFGGDSDDETPVKPGLFSGYYKDYKDSDNANEIFKRGNDRVETVTLTSVRYLPDYAFDSCERLRLVELGPNCADIGNAPFRGCYSLTVVGDNDYYKTQNGIVYSVNSDGSYTIEECLAARGRLVGTALIPDPEDGNISNVSAIKPGAFEDCDYINTVDLSKTAGLTVIPKNCFRNDPTQANCGQLSSVTLPRTVNEIQEGAFANALMLNELTIPGLEVFISAKAFESNDDKDNPKAVTRVRTYENSSARRYVATYGATEVFNLQWADIGNQWRVTFYDADGVMITDLVDQDGEPIENPQYVEDDEYVKLPADPVKEGWTFDGWLGTDNTKVSDRIHGDINFIAQGHNDDGSVNGRYVVEFYDGLDGKMLSGRGAEKDGKYYIDAGKSFTEMGYEAPTFPSHDNAANPRWSENWTEATAVNSNMTIVALYSSTTSGGSTITSGNSTNNGNNNNNNNNNTSSRSTSTTSTSNTSSSTSSSSTSTSSTTSDGRSVSMFTVLVQNGSGSGSYAQGTTVIVSAYPPAEGMVFSNWTTESNGVTLASNSLPVTTFVMPGNNVTITANYVPGTANTTTPPGTTGTTNNTTTPEGNTTVDITKPGISNKDLATANVNGSTDNFIIKISETDAATQAVAAALTNKYTSLENILYYAMDITLWDSTGTYQLTGDQVAGLSVDITIPIPDALVAYGGNNMAGAVVNGDQLENLNESFTTINGVPCIRFTATHFSPYTIYVDTGNLTEGMLDVTPKTGDPIHPKWFLSLGLACLSVILFMKKDRKVKVKTA